MDNSPPNDARLDDAEARMRRALGLSRDSAPTAPRSQTTPQPFDHHSNRRKFVRDGEVQVEVVHRSHQASAEGNPPDAARQTIRTLAAAKERAERSLVEAQATIKDLQTKLAHERMAQDEAIQRVQSEKHIVEQALQTVRAELAAQKIAQERSEQALRDGQTTISNLSEKLHLAQQPLTIMVKEELASERQRAAKAVRPPSSQPAAEPPANGEGGAHTVRRPPKEAVVRTFEKPVRSQREKPVKWWLGKR